MKTKYLAVALLLVATAVSQEFPQAPSAVKKQGNVWVAPLKSPSFYAGVGVFTASYMADIHHTTACEHSIPRGCYEAYKGHDRYIYPLPQIALVAGMTYGCEIMLTDHKWWRRLVCPGIGIGLSIQHWKDANTIYYEDPRARP